MKKKLQIEDFLASFDCFFGDLCVYFEPLWNNSDVNFEKISVTFTTEKKLQKQHFLAKTLCLFGDIRVHFEALLG